MPEGLRYSLCRIVRPERTLRLLCHPFLARDRGGDQGCEDRENHCRDQRGNDSPGRIMDRHAHCNSKACKCQSAGFRQP